MNLYFHKSITLLFFIHFHFIFPKVHIFGISTWAPINMEFIALNTWTLLPFNQWVSQKFKKSTLECGLLWNTIILKSEPPYYTFT